MGIFSPCRNPWRVLRNARCSGGLRGLLVVVGLLLAWPTPLPAAAPPERGGTIVWAVHESMPSFDLHYDNSYIVGQPIGPLYNGLLTFDVYHHEQIIGDLAERWDVAPDGTRITFVLRQGVTFHQKRREAPAFMPGRDRRWARWAQCPRAQQDSRSTRALNGRGNCREGSPGIHAGEDVPMVKGDNCTACTHSRIIR